MAEKNKISRRKSRQCLFQALYSCIYMQETFDMDDFLESFYDEDFRLAVDYKYFNEAFAWIQEKEKEMIYIVNKFAPKFDISSMSIVNLIPVFIASYEMLYLKCDNIPYKVSIDEALEITKTYSDEKWRVLVNWVLNSLKDHKEWILDEIEKAKPDKYYFFNKS